ncbi:unnamed protein product [Arabis nemorensis]|uniref:Uncharacterized protein n=1 Tax=Arabis nemorensis TaxID=586526 RepID=A0A565BVH4_9BRAS|nr:unnamed protein product [Arabis nemorensis]
MGKWNHRSRFSRRRSPSRWYSERPSSSGYGGDDGIPIWEKKFCEVIGSVPWQKVVEASTFKSWYQGNVTTWNDSACEETFRNEKKRFWSQVNGVHCDVSLPDPNLYISEVDWDTYIDPELIRDLEKAYFAPPDDVNTGFKRGRRDKDWNRFNPVPVEESLLGKKSNGWDVSESNTDHPKDRGWTLEAKPGCGNEKANDTTTSGDCLTTEGWREIQCKTKERGNDSWGNSGQGNDGWDKSGHQNKKAKGFESVPAEEYEMVDNPWEAKPSGRNETEKDTIWGSCSGKGWEDRGWGNNDCWGDGGWENRNSGNQVRETKDWRSKGYRQDFQEPKGSNPWKVGFVPENAGFRGYGANASGWQTHRASETNRRNWDMKRSSDGWGRRNQERDYSCGYNSNYQNSRPRRDDHQNRKVNFSAK